MAMRGGCKCNNIELLWHTVDYSVVPRKCQCRYCMENNAIYVSKSGSRINVRIHNGRLHKIVTQGSGNARFHVCKSCNELVFITADIGGESFGALNANCMINKFGFLAAIETDFSDQSAEEKRERWRKNWCHPVHITR